MTFDTSWETIHREHDWVNSQPDSIFAECFNEAYRDKPKVDLAVLDLGCGTGANTIYLARIGCKVLAVDGSDNAICKTREALNGTAERVDLRVADIGALDLPTASLDCILDLNCLACLPLDDVCEFITRARKWLKPQGWIFAKMACEPFDKSLIRSDYYRMCAQSDVERIFSGYDFHLAKADELTRNWKRVTHYLVTAWLLGFEGPRIPQWLKRPH